MKTYRPRLFKTFYYTSTKDSEGSWSRVGRACTRDSACRAAVMKLLSREFLKADVYDQDNIRVAILTRQGGVLKIVCI
jgi:hypothetical protein